MLEKKKKNKLFYHRIVTADEKGIHYDEHKCRKSYVKSG